MGFLAEIAADTLVEQLQFVVQLGTTAAVDTGSGRRADDIDVPMLEQNKLDVAK